MPGGYAEERNFVFHKIGPVAASLGHENPNSSRRRERGATMITTLILWVLVLALFNLKLERGER
jgi:hypothetical protein